MLAPSSSAYLRQGEDKGGGAGTGGGLDVDVAEHVVADVAADVELLHAAVAEKRGLGAVLPHASTARSPLDVVVDI